MANTGIPALGDRSAFDAVNYAAKHTNDTDTATGIHHTLGTGANQAAAGNHAHTTVPDHDHSGDAGDGGTFDAASLTSGAAADGQVLTADGSGGAAWEDPAGGAMALDDLTDVEAAAPDDGDLLTWDDGAGEWIAAAPAAAASAFTELTDVPGSYASQAGKLVRVNSGETALEFISPPAGTGDVVGPAGATDGHLAVFDGATGKLLKDGGAPGGGSTDVLMVQVFS